MLDHHDRRRRHVDADLDHRRRHQDLRAAGGEVGHHLVLLRRLHPPVHEADAIAEALLQMGVPLRRRGQVDDLGLLDQRADPIDARAAAHRAVDRRHDFVQPLQRQGARVDGLPPGRLLQQARGIEIAIGRHHQGARDRRRRHHQHVGGLALGRQHQALMHAEAVLLVDHGERQIAERDLLLEQRVRADGERDLARLQARQNRRARGRLVAPGQQRRPARRPPRPAARWWRNAGAPGSRSAPAARPGSRPRPPSAWPAAPPPSCRCRRRPAAGAACASPTPCRPGSPPASASARA